MTMYELVDTTFSGDLVAACQRGVKVRVILDQNLERSSNTPAYNQLNAVTNCSAVWANPVFQATHQKSFIVDGTRVAIMSLNLTSRYYTTTRDFALIENDPVDIAAIQATFNADYVSAAYTPGAGTDLIWSPTTRPVRPCSPSSTTAPKLCSSKTRRWARPTSSARSRRPARAEFRFTSP